MRKGIQGRLERLVQGPRNTTWRDQATELQENGTLLFGREDNDGPDRIKSGSLFIFLYISMTYIRLTTARKMEILSNQEEITSPSACGQTNGYRHSPVVFPAVLKNAWAILFAGPDIQSAHPSVDPVGFLGIYLVLWMGWLLSSQNTIN